MPKTMSYLALARPLEDSTIDKHYNREYKLQHAFNLMI